jgi:hypothetical protein
VDAELLVHTAEDVGDRLGGEERALGDLAAGEASGGELGDPPLGVGELRGRVRAAANPAELGPRRLAPVRRSERLEAGQRLSQPLVGEPLLLAAAMESALREQGPAAFEGIGRRSCASTAVVPRSIAASRSPRAAATSAADRLALGGALPQLQPEVLPQLRHL